MLTAALAALSAAAGAAAAAPETVRLVVADAYAADSVFEDGRVRDGPVPVRRVRLPFERVAATLLGHAGARLVADAPSDAILEVAAEGLALGRLYDYMENLQRYRSLRYAGARLAGRVTFAVRGGPDCTAAFAGHVAADSGIPVRYGRDFREVANLAPFAEAFRRPGSFVTAMAALVGEVYGPAALAAARRDDDAAVAGAAAAALAALTAGAAGPDVPAVSCVRPASALPRPAPVPS